MIVVVLPSRYVFPPENSLQTINTTIIDLNLVTNSAVPEPIQKSRKGVIPVLLQCLELGPADSED